MNLLELDCLSVDIGPVKVCRDLSLALRAGECWSVLGPNGAGKTTLLHTLAGLRRPLGGNIYLDGTNIDTLSRRAVARHIGLVFQDETDSFPATVAETALIGRHPHLGAFAWESAADHRQADAALETMDLLALKAREVRTLSGGERRRLAIATLLVQDSQVCLLDEPTNHLDLHHRIRILDHLTEMARERGKGLFMVLHDVNTAARYCDHALLLYGGGHAEYGETHEMLTAQRLSRLYRHPINRITSSGAPFFAPG